MKSSLGKLLPSLQLLFPSIVSGLLVTLCFPVVGLGPLSFIALSPMFVALLRVRPERRESFRAGFLMGAVCYVSMLWWVVKLVPSAGVTIPWLLTPALILLVLYLALYPAFYVMILGALTRFRPVPFLIAAPALWTVLELVRSRGELAFPWGVLGYTLSDHPTLIQTAEYAGVYGLSFLIVLVSALASVAVVLRTRKGRAACGLGAVLVAASMWLHGEATVTRVRRSLDPKLRIAVAQPNVELALKWNPEFKDSTFRLIEKQAARARREGARLVIFPETAAPVYIDNSWRDKGRLVELAVTLDLPVFIGFLDHRYDGPGGALNIYNSSGVFRPDGSVEKYDKRHLLPFGEALPLGSRYRWLRKLDFGQANFQPGPVRPPLEAGPATFTPLICFESVFPELCRDGVHHGSEVFVNITNDGWFGDTPGPYQHAQMAVVRAVEFRRYLARSANSGVSMVVAPTGDVVGKIDLYREGLLLADVTPFSDLTFYAQHGDAPLLAASLALLAAGSAAARITRRRGNFFL